jgi:hypothetical protein
LSDLQAQESRVDALVRLAGLVVFAFGAAMVYLTYTNATDAGFAPTIVPVYYFIGLVLAIAGFLATVSRFKG